MADYEKPEVYLRQIAQDIKTIREGIGKALFAMSDAESEIPERMRRFIMYMHDVHDVVNMYEERGQTAPQYVLREMERCDDRYRQLLTEEHSEDGTFAKVRREMAKDTENRWDHTRQLSAPTGAANETRNRTDDNGSDEDGA